MQILLNGESLELPDGATVADLLVRLVTLPIQRGHQDLGGGIHPLLSFEKFTDTLRCMFEERDIVLPATPGDSEHLMRRLLEMRRMAS